MRSFHAAMQRHGAASAECALQETPKAAEVAGGQLSCIGNVSTSYPENDASFGRYFGPGSRCIQESARFARVGFLTTEGAPKASAACYKMVCRGPPEARELYVLLEGRGVELRCPTATLIDLAAVPGATLAFFVISFPFSFVFLACGVQCCCCACVRAPFFLFASVVSFLCRCFRSRFLLLWPPHV